MLAPLKHAIVHASRDVPYLARLGGHIGLLALIGGAILLSRIQFDLQGNLTALPVAIDRAPEDLGVGGSELNEGYLTRAAVPLTIIPKRPRREVVRYTVQPGDTVSGIAEKFEIKPETIMWANAQLENDPDLLTIGEELMILPINGVYHTVAAGDTLESIAKKYKADASAILAYEWNQLKPGDTLTTAQKLIVPGGKKPIVQRAVRAYSGPIPESAARGTGSFGWPVSGVITQKYWSGHPGLDIAAPTGTPVLAADSGFVIFAGWDNSGFGKMILINHGNGFLTLYGHLDVFAVAVGDSVKKGQLIGRVGSTGRSTGPHVDFRIRQNGVWRNPFGFLR
jgi:LysM repeat protein